MEEIWKPIEGYEDRYEISNLGRIKSTYWSNNKIRNVSPTKHRYKSVMLNKNGEGKRFYIHRLVAEAFIPNPDNKPEVDHINKITFDNRVDNLRWVTREENMENCNRSGNTTKGKYHNGAKAVRCLNDGKEFGAMSEAVDYYGFTSLSAGSKIGAVCNKKRKSYKGLVFEFIKEK